MKGKRKWLASEKLAATLLEEMGYRILERHRKVIVEGVEVGEIDLIALGPDGRTYAVEVKAGRADVTAVRQTYVNAVLVGAKPLIVAKGFADESAEKLARELDVKLIALSDVFLVDAEELEEVVFNSVLDALANFILLLSKVCEITDEEATLLNAIASSATVKEAAERLGLDVADLMKRVAELRSKGKLPQWSADTWLRLKLAATVVTALRRFKSCLKGSVEENVSTLR